jgi:dihydrofolate reductase
MPKLRAYVTASLDGYLAGPDPTPEEPLGRGGEALHEWAFGTRTWRATHGMDGGAEATADDRVMALSVENVGATIMGRNMFGPVHAGPWDEAEPWHGWWGDEPPFHHPVFVLTHHPRSPLALTGTTFHFVTDGIEAALERAYDAAGGADVRVAGGAETIQQYVRAGLLDELHVTVAPVLLHGGTRLLDGLVGAPGYECAEVAATSVAHVRLVKA